MTQEKQLSELMKRVSAAASQKLKNGERIGLLLYSQSSESIFTLSEADIAQCRDIDSTTAIIKAFIHKTVANRFVLGYESIQDTSEQGLMPWMDYIDTDKKRTHVFTLIGSENGFEIKQSLAIVYKPDGKGYLANQNSQTDISSHIFSSLLLSSRKTKRPRSFHDMTTDNNPSLH